MSRPEDKYDCRVLEEVASGRRVTQRSISGQLGVALGLANRVIRRLVDRGFVRVVPPRVGYEVTPLGWEALRQARRRSLETTVDAYTHMREHICATLAIVAAQCDGGDGRRNVVFYGAGSAAEIAYVALRHSDLTLVGVVDDYRRGRFFDHAIVGPEYLTAQELRGTPYSRLLVTSIRHSEAIHARLRQRGVPESRICSL